MSNQMKIVLKLKQKHRTIMIKKNNIIINLKKKKHIKLVFSPISKEYNREKDKLMEMEMHYNYAYEMDRYDDYNRHIEYGDDHCCVYDDYDDYDDYSINYEYDEEYEAYVNENRKQAERLQNYYDTLMIN